MASLLRNLVLELAAAPGVGTIALTGCPSGRTTFAAAFGDGAQAFYFATDGELTEWGIGTVAIGLPCTLSRDTVIRTSAGGAAKVNFTRPIQVYCEAPAERMVLPDAANATVPIEGRRLTGVAAATAADNAVRLDQLAWTIVEVQELTAAAQLVAFQVPAAARRLRLEFQDFAPVANGAPPAVRLELDGVLVNGPSDYVFTYAGQNSGTGRISAGSAGGAQLLGPGMRPDATPMGWYEADTATRQALWQVVGTDTVGEIVCQGTGRCYQTGVLTAVRLEYWSGSQIARGRVRLLVS